ncbi:MAG: YggS family pyridoxal phosphate-dependent enzyme [Actinomycetaceae bacterium]
MDYPTALSVEDLTRNLARVRARIDEAAERTGREAGEVRLLPVSKTVPEDRVRLAIEAGCHQLGENKVQEAVRKHDALVETAVSWSIIGHLQRNKARDVVAIAQEFHALDTLRLAEALDRRLQAAGRGLDVYVQVNTSGEDSKYGLHPDDVLDTLASLAAFDSLRVQGLMTLAVFSPDTARVRSCFRLLRDLRDRARDVDPGLVGPGGLSMGMSGDYEAAIEEGATVVRVGQAIFGERATPDSHYWPTPGS